MCIYGGPYTVMGYFVGTIIIRGIAHWTTIEQCQHETGMPLVQQITIR